MKKVLRWIKEGLDEFRSPYPPTPRMSMKEWLKGAVEMTVFAASMMTLWVLIYALSYN